MPKPRLLVADHNGEHDFGVPAQPVVPAASNAIKVWMYCDVPSLQREATYTTPFATAGDESTTAPVVAVHNGAHDFGVPEQPVVPAASNAYNL